MEGDRMLGIPVVKDRIVIITGAGQGIGRKFAHCFAKAGAIPVIAECNENQMQSVAEEIRGEGGEVFTVKTDVSEPRSVATMVDAVVARYGRIDVLVNNAGINVALKRGPFYEISFEEWERVMRVNISGCFLCAKTVFPVMRKAGWGRIINMSSAAVLLGLPNLVHYVTSKAGLIGMTRSMAREAGQFGITVNAILPGMVETEVQNPDRSEERVTAFLRRQAIPRMQTPEDLIGILFFLASPASDFMTGQALLVDGGLAHL
jgi:NAD(P)-dependent dehydrogenase (short-subunit alcohol dehydrogenase family)